MSHRRSAGEPGPEVTLPITPMLDMSFQLLFFFMATFNPTDPEGAQTLALTREKKIEKAEDKDKDKMAQDKSKVKDDIIPDKDKKQKKDEEPEVDSELRLVIEVGGGGKQPISLTAGGRVVKSADKLDDDKLLESLRKKLVDRANKAPGIAKAKLEEAKEKLREANKSKMSADAEKAVYNEAYLAALGKVRVQPTVDVPWGQAFDAMNECTNMWRDAFDETNVCKREDFHAYCNKIGFAGVALTTPTGYVLKDKPPPSP
jgi:hypothetical protein